jgi:hypothetical protein
VGFGFVGVGAAEGGGWGHGCLVVGLVWSGVTGRSRSSVCALL